MSDASVDKVKGFKLLLTLILLFSSATSAYSRAEDKYDILYFAEGSTIIGKSTIGAYAEWCLHYNQGGFSYYYAGPYISIPITGWLAAQSAIYYIQDSGRPYAIWPSAGIKVSINRSMGCLRRPSGANCIHGMTGYASRPLQAYPCGCHHLFLLPSHISIPK